METVIKNALITSADIQIERGMLTSSIGVKYGNHMQQGFGGYRLDGKPCKGSYHFATTYIKGIMAVADVQEWSLVAGKYIRVECEYTKIHKIGHILKDIWYDPSTNRIYGEDYEE